MFTVFAKIDKILNSFFTNFTSFVPEPFKFDRRRVTVPLAEACFERWCAINH